MKIKCRGCGEEVDEEDVTWATQDGRLTMHGNPYCDACLPNLKEEI